MTMILESYGLSQEELSVSSLWVAKDNANMSQPRKHPGIV